MKKIILLTVLSLSLQPSFNQEQTEKKVQGKIYGYAMWNGFFDTRKSREARDGELYFYPLKQELDINGHDLNAVNKINMLALNTRIGFKVEGFEALGAQGVSQIEADFFGTNQDNINLMRIRHANIQLNWERSALLTGMYWHPVIVDEMIPGNVSFGAGAPFHSLNRAAQVRYTYKLTQNVKITGAAIVNTYHRSAGPYEAQRNSAKPELFAQISGSTGSDFLFGFSGSYKWLRPRTEIALPGPGNYRLKTEKELGSFYSHAFGMLKLNNFTIKVEGVYGQELSFLNMIGGYGKITGTDGDNGDYEYTNLNTLSLWLDASYKLGKWGFGFFAGRQSLQGANDNYTSINSATNDDISQIYRLSPRIVYSVDKLAFAFEYMLTGAIYGNTWDEKHVVIEKNDPVVNNRTLLLVKYSF